MPSASTIACYFDGACKRNQFASKGPMWVAYVVGKEEHVHEIPDLPMAQGTLRSNNIAEYSALIRLLRRVSELDALRPRRWYVLHGDSQLVVYQMQGRYRVREPHLVPLHSEARRLAAGMAVTFRWVPRDENPAGHLLEAL